MRRTWLPAKLMFWDLVMDNVGIALVVGGTAYLFSGLIFLIPVRGSSPAQEVAFEDSREQVERHLSEDRRNRGEIDM